MAEETMHTFGRKLFGFCISHIGLYMYVQVRAWMDCDFISSVVLCSHLQATSLCHPKSFGFRIRTIVLRLCAVHECCWLCLSAYEFLDVLWLQWDTWTSTLSHRTTNKRHNDANANTWPSPKHPSKLKQWNKTNYQPTSSTSRTVRHILNFSLNRSFSCATLSLFDFLSNLIHC